MHGIETLNESEIEMACGGGMGFFENIGNFFDNPGSSSGRLADRFIAWYRLTPNEDPNLFID